MDEPISPNPTSGTTSPSAADFAPLTRLVEGLMDADMLLAEDSSVLLEAIQAAHQSLDAGDAAAVRGHAARFVQTLEALVQTGKLDQADGRMVIEAVHQILDAPTG